LRGVKLPVLGPVVIGRSPGADIVINAGYVSGRHARFSIFNDSLVVEDMGSTNGTVVNGNQISAPITLQAGDLVSIGDVTMRVGKQ
jgi:pSer/pThr/pTyr-binding forkhead associated (FHA) protein